MRIRNFIVLVIAAALLSSCLVKSLHPFYTKETLSFNEKLLGKWKDNKGATWEILSFKEAFFQERTIHEKNEKMDIEVSFKIEGELKGDDLKLYKEYQHGYYIKRTKGEKEATFFANPFKIGKQYFLDFTPLFFDLGVSSLTEEHMVSTHSLVKFDFLADKRVSLSWLDEDRLEELFKENRIKIEHEKTGVDKSTILLTAKPKELQKFIKKYMASNIENKWKTDTKYILTSDHSKP